MSRLVVIDMQEVFTEGPWVVPRFAEVTAPIRRLVTAFGPRVTCTRFVAPEKPAGAWRRYYERWPFALQPPDSPIYRLIPGLTSAPTVDATTFSKWTPELATLVGDGPLVLAGVTTDCCVLSTAVAAADAGVEVLVVADACAGVTDESHEQALAVLRLYGPLVTVTSLDAALEIGETSTKHLSRET